MTILFYGFGIEERVFHILNALSSLPPMIINRFHSEQILPIAIGMAVEAKISHPHIQYLTEFIFFINVFYKKLISLRLNKEDSENNIKIIQKEDKCRTKQLLSFWQLHWHWFQFTSFHSQEQPIRSGKMHREYAKGDLVKATKYTDSIASLPKEKWSFLGNTFKEVQKKEMNLGLDLKGGMNVILEVSVEDILKALSNYNPDKTFTDAMARAKAESEPEPGRLSYTFRKSFPGNRSQCKDGCHFRNR